MRNLQNARGTGVVHAPVAQDSKIPNCGAGYGSRSASGAKATAFAWVTGEVTCKKCLKD